MLTRPRVLLHVEGAVVLILAGLTYWVLEGNWLVFAVLLLAPDVGMVGFLRNTRLGAATYNLFTRTACRSYWRPPPGLPPRPGWSCWR